MNDDGGPAAKIQLRLYADCREKNGGVQLRVRRRRMFRQPWSVLHRRTRTVAACASRR